MDFNDTVIFLSIGMACAAFTALVLYPLTMRVYEIDLFSYEDAGMPAVAVVALMAIVPPVVPAACIIFLIAKSLSRFRVLTVADSFTGAMKKVCG